MCDEKHPYVIPKHLLVKRGKNIDLSKWHLDTCLLKYGGGRCTCGLYQPGTNPEDDVRVIGGEQLAR